MAANNELVLNVVLAQPLDEESISALQILGMVVHTAEGASYRYMQDSGAGLTGQAYAVAVDDSGGNPDATLLTKTLADAGHVVAFVATNAAVTADYYFWACIEAGPGSGPGIWTLASAAVDVALYTTATAGALDDTSTSQTKINGVRLNTATAGAAAINTSATIQSPRAVI